MSSPNSQVTSSIGRVNYRALNGKEVRQIIAETLIDEINKVSGLKQQLTFHAFHLDWGFKITSLEDTPVPPEVDRFLTVYAPDLDMEEFEKLKSDLELLKAKRDSIKPFLELVKKVDEYLAKVEVTESAIGEVSDNRTPDILRQKHNLPILVTRQVGPQMAEVPLVDTSIQESQSEIKLDV